MRYAHIIDGVVDNVIRWDGEAELAVPGELVEVPEAAAVAPGWTYDGQAFVAPAADDGLSIEEMLRAIDDEAERRIHAGPGFEYPAASGQFFSLSANAQAKWNAVMGSAQAVLVGIVPAEQIYPFRVRTKDDLIEFTCPDASTAMAMCLTAIGTAQAHLAACRMAKGEVLAAADLAAARAAFDAYMGGS
jgi:hypothetical protein